jgi:hypothetical protein
MDPKELALLRSKAKAERDQGVLAVEEKYKDRLHSLQVTWDLANENGSMPPAATPQRGRPATADGPVGRVREACKALRANFTVQDALVSVNARGAALSAKQVSSAMSKLIDSGEIRITTKRTGKTPAIYEATVQGVNIK